MQTPNLAYNKKPVITSKFSWFLEACYNRIILYYVYFTLICQNRIFPDCETPIN